MSSIIKLDDNVEGAVLITYGDTDGDGKKGISVRMYADVPFDGSEACKPVLELPEMERVPDVDVPDKIGDVIKLMSPVARGVLSLKAKLLG